MVTSPMDITGLVEETGVIDLTMASIPTMDRLVALVQYTTPLTLQHRASMGLTLRISACPMVHLSMVGTGQNGRTEVTGLTERHSRTGARSDLTGPPLPPIRRAA